jgi:hypothetical protein
MRVAQSLEQHIGVFSQLHVLFKSVGVRLPQLLQPLIIRRGSGVGPTTRNLFVDGANLRTCKRSHATHRPHVSM